MTILEALEAWNDADASHKEKAWRLVINTAYESNTNWPLAVTECLMTEIKELTQRVPG